ncbi:hypothetical protein [Streptomyces platensis]|uniref:hypothetical protein n=1 Tax=Streptomyces platensis TaxID=58346 RepID=UPI002E8078B0|nr:hypothetical protein [Streptomyces platensis]WUB82368.1 hypothetical protein OG424_26165 [Streptomyces platensis]
MTIAALPDHNRRTDPQWLNLFNRYRHVITPLRYNGWTTDIEISGAENHLRADLGDGTELIIASGNSLPLDPSEVTGWSVVRQDIEDPARHTVLYDSTPEGPHRHHGSSLIPMFGRIEVLDAPKSVTPLYVSATYTAPYGMQSHQSTGVETPGAAVARFFEFSRQLVNTMGYKPLLERLEPKGGYPSAQFETESGRQVTVRVMRSYD